VAAGAASLAALASSACSSFGEEASSGAGNDAGGGASAVDAAEAGAAGRACDVLGAAADVLSCDDFDVGSPLSLWTVQDESEQTLVDLDTTKPRSAPNAARMSIRSGTAASPDARLQRSYDGPLQRLSIEGAIRVDETRGGGAQVLRVALATGGYIALRTNGAVAEASPVSATEARFETILGASALPAGEWTTFALALDFASRDLRLSIGGAAPRSVKLDSSKKPSAVTLSLGAGEPEASMERVIVAFDDVVVRGTR